MLWPVSAKAVVVQEGRVLLARNDRGEWELPGGRIEGGEAPADAAVREVAEETGLTVRVTAQLGVHPFEVLPGRAVLLVGFACAVVRDRPLVVSDEHEAVAWHPLDGLDDLALPAVYRALIAEVDRGRIVLLGDSHLANLDRGHLHRLRSLVPGHPPVVNQAAGGASAPDLPAELDASDLRPLDRIVVSVGTNDCAPWKRVPLDRFTGALDAVLGALRDHRVVVLQPPPVDERLQVRSGRTRTRTEQDRGPYAAAVAAVAASHGAAVAEVDGGGVVGTDGVHLSDVGAELLVARLAEALARPGPRSPAAAIPD